MAESNGSEKPVISDAQLSEVIPSIIEDCLYNIIHDIVLEVHRTEKQLRMTSVAVQAERIASQASGAPPTPTTSNSTPSKAGGPPSTAPQISIPVPGGHYENGKVYLKGNTLKQVKDIYCPHCKLPRLLFPVTGAGARLPDDPNVQYCNLHPFIQKPGHDIYGNPFPIDQTNKTKRERELIKKQEKAERDNTPGSQDTNEDGGITGEQFVKRMLSGGKPASYVPWHTCPLCKRSLLITKFAQHLEKCLGIGGRAARNTAAARLSGMNGSASGSVQGSRMGTPTPSSQGRRDQDDDDDDTGPPKKKSKKELSFKKDKKEKLKEKLIIKVNANAKDGKKLSKGATSNPTENGKGDGTPSRKRDREDTADDIPLAKKAKIKGEDSSTGSP
ncbi:hypothetical protein, variant [Verruconis gallopava]|uniref:SAGA-associated factor 11 n=1 Tax=Verruconis gallopava TaxID=253628 RepID=A0A0D2BCK6_9PEZI|nr:uncharacterized protein PV09_00054 [Verruconis gallopava]XP_016218979.1 hypothetical protein, variant [Verruconis gallopava]KIW09109.1 hypothetical protein PV09_00054 [Verruconis gallopava]KIW09110.1 hypothetical protein, variant [Verruconis gallopava]